MKYVFTLLLLFFLCTCVRAQIDVTYTTGIPRQSDDGLAYEIDVLISTTTPFKFGSGQLYFDYDTGAFGENVEANGHVEILRPAGSILATTNGFPVYQTPIVNDNTTNRVSVAYLQGTSAGCLPGPNVSETPALLFVLRLVFVAGQAGTTPDVCFASQDLFIDQTFTACGPDGGCGFADCQQNPGTQITNDVYQCGAILPLELQSFTAIRDKEDALLNWVSTFEEGSSHFEVEKSNEGNSWSSIGRVSAVGSSLSERNYAFRETDFAPHTTTAYYRLRMVDLDGTYTYSEVRQLSSHPADGFELEVYPNPITQGFYVKLPTAPEKSRSLTLFAADGRAVLRTTILAGASSVTYVDISKRGLYKGLYLLTVEDFGGCRVVVFP